MMPRPPKRLGPRLGGVGFDGAIPFVTSLGIQPLSEAVRYRVFKAYPAIIVPGSFEAAERLLLEPWLLGGFQEVIPQTTWEWLKSIKNSRRRRILIRAFAKRTERGEPHPKIDVVSPFVKTENLPWFKVVNGAPDIEAFSYVARLIQAPHDETHITAGPYMKPLTHALKQHWGPDNWVFYASATPEKLDGWLRRNQHSVSFYWSDYSGFDGTWSRHAWRLVERFYHHIYPDAPPEFWDVLQNWRCPKGRVKLRKEDAEMKYKSEEMMLSGRDDTALANVILNGIALSLSFAAAFAGVQVSDVTCSMLDNVSHLVRIAVLGDDSLVCCDFDVAPYAAAINRGIESFGLEVKACHSPNLWDVTFLGCMPYLTRGGLFWGPTIGRRLFKAFWQAEPEGHLPSWTKGVAMQMARFRCVPFLSELGQRVVGLLSRHTGVERFDEHKPYHSRSADTEPWDDLTVEWMCRRYPGFSPGSLQQDLKNLKKLYRLPAVMHSEVFSACIAQDEL